MTITSKLDASDGYQRINIGDRYKKSFAFTTYYNLYQFLEIFFKL